MVITDECINCGACEPECPNTAIPEYAFIGRSNVGKSSSHLTLFVDKASSKNIFYTWKNSAHKSL